MRLVAKDKVAVAGVGLLGKVREIDVLIPYPIARVYKEELGASSWVSVSCAEAADASLDISIN